MDDKIKLMVLHSQGPMHRLLHLTSHDAVIKRGNLNLGKNVQDCSWDTELPDT